MKTKIKKYIRKYIPVICTLLFIPILSISTSALTIYDTEVVVPGGTGSTSAALWVDTGNTDRIEINDYYFFDFSVTAGNTDSLSLAFTSHSWDIALDTENYDYWLQMIVEANNSMTYFPTTFSATKYQSTTSSSANVNVTLSDVKISQYDGVQGGSFMNRFTCLGKLPDTFEGNFRTINTTGSVGAIPSKISVFVAVHRFPKGTDVSAVNSIIAAINNQTSSLGGKLDGIDSSVQQGNDLIENGNSDTGDVVEDFNEIFEDFNTELSKVDEFEAEIVDEFNTANDAYLTELNNFSLTGSLMNASSWLSTSMQRVYNHSSDYKMLWLVPLLFGIPVLLFVIKRGKDDEE